VPLVSLYLQDRLFSYNGVAGGVASVRVQGSVKFSANKI
jgi:hypothetical protein